MRLGWLGLALGAVSLVAFSALGGDEHRHVILLGTGLPALLGGGLLVVAGRMLLRPGTRAVFGQALLLGFAAYWLALLMW